MEIASLERWMKALSSMIPTAMLTCILVLAATVLLPSKRFNKNRIAYVEQSQLLTILKWGTVPRLALDRYICQGYDKIIKPWGRPFIVTICGMETNILPAKYLSFLKGENRENLSLCQGFEDMFNMTTTTGPEGRHDHVEIDVVAKYINPRLSDLFPEINDQAESAFEKAIGDAKDWKSLNTFELGTGLVFRVTSRILVGRELCKKEEYVEATVDYAKSFLMSGFVWPIRPFGPELFRKWGYWLGTYGLRRDIGRAFRDLLPLIHHRIDELNGTAKTNDEHTDMLQGLLEMNIPDPLEATPLRHAHRVLHITFAASAVTSALVLHTFHQLLATPEFLEPLRAEIEGMLENNDGWTEKALGHMTFLESFIRELLRLNPPSIMTGQRTVLGQPVRFDEGLTLPERSRIAFPTLYIHLDPDNYEDAQRFDPYRFVRRKVDGTCRGENISASRIDEKYLSFGYGKQACPGRFLAVRQLKLILAKLLLRYDFRWAKGEPPKGLKKMFVEGQIFPDISTRIALKRRENIKW